jgi:putative Holliday junction resolvase
MSRPAPEQPRHKASDVAGKLIALDVGLSRIGVATCDPLRLSVRPLLTLTRSSRREDFARLAAIVIEQEAVAVICGLPLNMDGSDSAQTRSVRKWAMRLAHALRALLGRPLPVIFWDERLSTYAAQQLLAGDEPRSGEDAVAAAVILRSYLDSQNAGERVDFGRIDLPPKTDTDTPA